MDSSFSTRVGSALAVPVLVGGVMVAGAVTLATHTGTAPARANVGVYAMPADEHSTHSNPALLSANGATDVARPADTSVPAATYATSV